MDTREGGTMLRNRFVAICVVVFACASVQAEEPKPAVKKFAFRMKDAKWEDVLDWYSKASGRKADVRVQPKGTFTHTPEEDREFTLGEITDLINEALAEQKLMLIPHRKTFAVVSSDGKIDPKLIPAVEWSEIQHFGRTAIVETTIHLALEVNEEAADELKKFVTPFGEILRVKGKSISLRDTVGNILRIREALRPL
jgi:hypothetical protein